MNLTKRKNHYTWKRCVCVGVTADTAVEEFQRVEQQFGALTAKNLLNISRDESAPLHGAFEWNDTVAGELYRESQAAQIIRAVVADVSNDEQILEVRAWLPVADTPDGESEGHNRYVSIERIMENSDYFMQVKNRALAELVCFEKKYANILKIQTEVEHIKSLVSTMEQ